MTAAIVGLASGAASIYGASKADKAAKRGAALSREQMELMKEQLKKAEEYIKKGEPYLEKAEGALDTGQQSMQPMIDTLDKVAGMLNDGDIDINTARTIFNNSLGDMENAQAITQITDKFWDNAIKESEAGRADMESGKLLANHFNQELGQLSEQYKTFASDRMQDWEDTFGNLRENVVSYYNDLDPERYSSQMKTQIANQMSKSMRMFDEQAAQNGIYTSGMKQQAQKDMAFDRAKAFAQADIEGQNYVDQQRALGYSQLGEPYRQQAQQGMEQSYLNAANLQQMGVNTALNQGNLSGQYQQNMSGMYGNIAGQNLSKGQLLGTLASGTTGIGGAIGDLANYPIQKVGMGLNVAGQYGNVSGLYNNLAGQYSNLTNATTGQAAAIQGNASQYGNNANTYAQSAAGYGKASGQMFGAGMKQLGQSLPGLFGGNSSLETMGMF